MSESHASVSDQATRHLVVCLRAVPALLYAISGNLGASAASLLPLSTFQVVAQMKVVLSAILSVLLLRQRRTLPQWLALCGVCIGAVLVAGHTATNTTIWMADGLGLAFLLSSMVFSCCAGLWSELRTKRDMRSIWAFNTRLALFSFAANLVATQVARGSVFHMTGSMHLMTASVGAFGGALVALAVALTDSVQKSVAASCSVAAAAALDVVIWEAQLRPAQWLGVGIVVCSGALYASLGAQPVVGPNSRREASYPTPVRTSNAVASPH